MKSICGIDCSSCPLNATCQGCAATGGKPFGGPCTTAIHCQDGTHCAFKAKLIRAFNSLGIQDMPEVTDLNALAGFYVNLPYPLPSGESVKFWNEQTIYLGNQLPKRNSHRLYGLVADEQNLMVSEYDPEGLNPTLILFKRWNETL